MKKSQLLLSIIMMLFAFSTKAQWVSKVSGTNQALYDIHFPSLSTGYAVGYAGTIVKTTDAGETWNTLNINTTEDLYAVHFINETKGFVAGDEHIFQTIDGGTSWSALSLPTGHSFRDLLFLDAQTGFCTGAENLILKTTDGGAAWTPTVTPATNNVLTLSSIHFPTPLIGYAVGVSYNWGYLKTTDGGENWTSVPINTPLPNLSNLETVFFTDVDKGFIGGWYLSAFVATTDGGSNWVSLDEEAVSQIYSIYFPTTSHGYAVGWIGQIFTTTDEGATWHHETLGNKNFYAVYAVDENTAYIVGENGAILKTSNGGVTAQSEVAAMPIPIRVFPNPAIDAVRVDLSAYANRAVRIELYDVQGERMKVYETNAASDISPQIDLSACQNGVYLLRVQAAGLPDVTKPVVVLRE